MFIFESYPSTYTYIDMFSVTDFVLKKCFCGPYSNVSDIIMWIVCIQQLTFPYMPKVKKWSMTGFPRSLHFLGHSSLIHLAIWECRSEIKALIITAVPSRNANASWKPMNSMAELLPAWFAWKAIKQLLLCKKGSRCDIIGCEFNPSSPP